MRERQRELELFTIRTGVIVVGTPIDSDRTPAV
jgi:hypothetical protein